jgi:hypothetical protein
MEETVFGGLAEKKKVPSPWDEIEALDLEIIKAKGRVLELTSQRRALYLKFLSNPPEENDNG